jgi:hypothetical protein
VSKVRLTPTQLAVLRDAAENPTQVWQTLAGTYSWDEILDRQVTAVVNRLQDQRPALLVRGEYRRAGQKFEMVPTDFGREVLAEHSKEE